MTTSPLPSPDPDRSSLTILGLLRERVLDAELAAIVWLLLDSRVSLIVAGSRGPLPSAGGSDAAGEPDRRLVLAALLDLLPAAARRIAVDDSGAGLERLTSSDAVAAWLTGLDLRAAPAPGVRIAFRSLSRGAAMAASVDADALEDVLARLRAPDLRLTDDELTFLGMVLIVRRVDVAAGGEPGPARRAPRIVAAHYVRPLVRDPAGHLQRPPPAVLAVWEPRTGEFEHFAWGIAADLAGRAGVRPGDLDREIGRRRDYLTGLVEAGLRGPDQLRAALDGYRMADRGGSAG